MIRLGLLLNNNTVDDSSTTYGVIEIPLFIQLVTEDDKPVLLYDIACKPYIITSVRNIFKSFFVCHFRYYQVTLEGLELYAVSNYQDSTVVMTVYTIWYSRNKLH